MEEEKRPIRGTIIQRLNELSTAYRALARKSRMYNIIAGAFKVLIIISGAFVAAGNTTIAVLGNANQTVLVIVSIFIAHGSLIFEMEITNHQLFEDRYQV
jgi:hypothetical protein